MLQGLRFLRAELPGILATRTDALSPRMLRTLEDLSADWRHLDARIEGLSSEIEALARQDQGCERLMTVPGIGPIRSWQRLLLQATRPDHLVGEVVKITAADRRSSALRTTLSGSSATAPSSENGTCQATP